MSNTKKKAKPTSNYIKTFREGAIAANVFRKVTPDGHAYLTFELSRSWQSPNGARQGYASWFYPHNAEAIANVSHDAAKWILENPTAADEGFQANPQQVAA